MVKENYIVHNTLKFGLIFGTPESAARGMYHVTTRVHSWSSVYTVSDQAWAGLFACTYFILSNTGNSLLNICYWTVLGIYVVGVALYRPVKRAL